jgi:hypothetical protein
MTDREETANSPDHVLETVRQAQLERPKGANGVFDLPCGYLDSEGRLHREVQVREITGHEEDMLGSKAVPGYKKVGTLISACMVRIGNITDKKTLATIGDELTIGDRVFLMFAIRRTTLGDEYPFRGVCPNERCNYRGLFTLDLSDLEVKEMPDPMKRIYDIQLPSGKTARYRPLLGKDEESLSKASNSDEAMSLAILMRLEMLSDQPPTIAMVKNLGMRDRNALREAFDNIEGGVDTTLEMTCPICGTEFEEELDVGQAGFFFPSSAQKGSKRKSST